MPCDKTPMLAGGYRAAIVLQRSLGGGPALDYYRSDRGQYRQRQGRRHTQSSVGRGGL